MKLTAWILVIVVALTSLVAAPAAAVSEESMRQAVDRKIARCERKAVFAQNRHRHLREIGQAALERAAFYRNHKDALSREMAQAGLEAKPYKVHYFLICTFFNPSRLASVTAPAGAVR